MAGISSVLEVKIASKARDKVSAITILFSYTTITAQKNPDKS
jgi:hypothetical protein